MRAFFNRTLSKSNFYREYFKDGEFVFRNVPIIGKKEFMENFNQINTVNIDRENAMNVAIESEKSRDFKSEIHGITVGLSTGTSGKREYFLFQKMNVPSGLALF